MIIDPNEEQECWLKCPNCKLRMNVRWPAGEEPSGKLNCIYCGHEIDLNQVKTLE